MTTVTPHFVNPLEETVRNQKNAEPCIMVIFGATGDLTARKLVPALFNMSQVGDLPAHFACVGFARRDKDNAIFRKEMKEAVFKHSRTQPVQEAEWNAFEEKIFYHISSFDDNEGYSSLKVLLENLDQKFGTRGNRVFYLSTQPSHFPEVIEKLDKSGLIYDKTHVKDKWSRIIIEKPFGRNFTSANDLQSHICRHLDEEQIYRIDHYLGKETVQNLMVLRFSNEIFEAVWNYRHIDHVQITVGENIGVGTRGNFFEEAGILRDIIQNHMMQLLCLVAMEPPASLRADSIRDEKVKVLESVRPFPHNQIDDFIVRGQYGPGFVHGEASEGYREENNVAKDSNIETFVAMELFIDNWRWNGVPFYLRAGKRLPKRATEIAITFKSIPGFLFGQSAHHVDPNILVIRIQPDEGISLKMNCKIPGLSGPIQPVKMDFRYGSYFGSTPPEAYEKLLRDCMAGDTTLFARADEVLNSWSLFDPVLHHWEHSTPITFPNYPSGTWGPDASDHLLERSGRRWRLL